MGRGPGGGGSGMEVGLRGVRLDVTEELKFLWKFRKKNWGGGPVGRIGEGWVGGVRVDVNEEFKFLRKFQKKNIGGGGGARGRVGGSRWM